MLKKESQKDMGKTIYEKREITSFVLETIYRTQNSNVLRNVFKPQLTKSQ